MSSACGALLRSYDEASVPAPPGTTLLIAFAGLAGRLGGAGGVRAGGDRHKEGLHAGMPSHEFVASCRRAGISHTLFCRDPHQCWYLRGLGEHRANGFDDTIATLRAEVDALRPTRVVTIGASMGGYAAIRAALAIAADVAIAFSPTVLIDSTERANAALPAMPFDDLLRQLKRVLWLEDTPMTSLVSVAARVSASSSAPTLIEVHVGANEEGDCREAKLLRDSILAAPHERAMCADVQVHVWPGCDHNVVTSLRDDGTLHAILEQHCTPLSSASKEQGTSTLDSVS